MKFFLPVESSVFSWAMKTDKFFKITVDLNMHYTGYGALSLAIVSKDPPASAGDLGWIPGSGRSLMKGRTALSTGPALRIPWTEEPGGLQSTGSQGAVHD